MESALTVEDADCKKHGKETEKLEKSEEAEKAFDDMEDNIVLCTITENDESMQKKSKSFASDVKFSRKHYSL